MKTIFRIKILLAILISLCYQPLLAQNKEIKGIVTSAEDGEPLIGATISVKGNEAQGVVTDIEGKYILQIPNSDCTLVVAYLGMKTQELKAPSSGILNISLEAESMNLDEVVVTGYGNFSKSSFTGSAPPILRRYCAPFSQVWRKMDFDVGMR